MQLYTLVRDVVIPVRTRRNPLTGEFQSETITYPAAIVIANPDGAPNIYLEMYMLDVAGKYTIRRDNGGSLKSIACSLTALARFCFTQRCQLWEMDDGLMKQAVGELANEPNRFRPHQKKRNENTIGRIVSDWVAFFRWLQQTIFPDRMIVGLITTNPQIVLVQSMTTGKNGRRRISETFPFVPASATTEPKRPIGRELIRLLWDAVATMGRPETYSDRYKSRFSDESFLLDIEFMRRRRELLLQLLEGTGARPSEITLIPLEANLNCRRSCELIIPTLKRGDDKLRSIKIDPGLAMQVELFAKKYRYSILERLRMEGVPVAPCNRLFISNRGNAISGGTLETEFSRIVAIAGINDQQACMSMFRHRFITKMVAIHLQEFIGRNPTKNSPHMMTESDYLSILKKVAVFTGHSDERSLMNYIDWAWDELGVFEEVDNVRRFVFKMDQKLNELAQLQSELQLLQGMPPSAVLNMVIQKIRSIRDDTYDAMKKHNSANHPDL